jgi:hypothetical protein
MIGDMKNRARAALVVLACLFALTGCVKVDADLKVNSNETVSGSMRIGVDKQLMESSGTSLDKVRQQVESGIKDTTTDGVNCNAFDDNKYIGSDCKFDQVPFSKMGSSTGDGVGFRKEGDKFVVTVKALDLGKTLPAGRRRRSTSKSPCRARSPRMTTVPPSVAAPRRTTAWTSLATSP